MNTHRTKNTAYHIDNTAFWRQRLADHYKEDFTFDYGDFYRKPGLGVRALRAGLLFSAAALLVGAWLWTVLR